MGLAKNFFGAVKKAATAPLLPERRIGLLPRGCSNRPFFLIGVIEKNQEPCDDPVEQLGNFDPMPNQFNEKIVSIDFERLEYWIKKDVYPTPAVAKLLGLCGYLPIHPETFQEAWKNRTQIKIRLDSLREAVKTLQAANVKQSGGDSPNTAETESQGNVDSKT